MRPVRGPWSWFLVTRLVIALIGLVGAATFVNQHTGVVGDASALNPLIVWHKWDLLWYERIALHGYGYEIEDLKGQAAAGFFPLYPLAMGVVLELWPSLSFFWVGVVFSNLFTGDRDLRPLAPSAPPRRRPGRPRRHGDAGPPVPSDLSIPYTESCVLLSNT